MDQQRPLVERVLDLLVYAPVGLASQLRDDADRLVTQGRTTVHERVQVARWVGEMAVHVGRRKLEHRLHPAPSLAPGSLGPVVPDPAATELPFEGYDALSAAEIVKLLAQLPAVELEMVRDFEVANRARRTVLAKLDQLLGS